MKDPVVTIVDGLMALIEERNASVARAAEIGDVLRQMRAVLDHELGAAPTLLSVDISEDVAHALAPLPPFDTTHDRLALLEREAAPMLDASLPSAIEPGHVVCRIDGCTNTFSPMTPGRGGRPRAYCSDECRTQGMRRRAAISHANGRALRKAGVRLKPPAARIEETHETVWSGGPGLTSAAGHSSLHNAGARA